MVLMNCDKTNIFKFVYSHGYFNPIAPTPIPHDTELGIMETSN